jgi:hypothetical protein
MLYVLVQSGPLALIVCQFLSAPDCVLGISHLVLGCQLPMRSLVRLFMSRGQEWDGAIHIWLTPLPPRGATFLFGPENNQLRSHILYKDSFLLVKLDGERGVAVGGAEPYGVQ